MTKRLEEILNLPENKKMVEKAERVSEKHEKKEPPALLRSMEEFDKISSALPQVKGLGDISDSELDSLAQRATDAYDDLMDLGMNVDSRYASEIFGVASQMLGHAITAKNAKINKKLKIIELQLKKAKLDIDTGSDDNLPTAQGHVLDRNELLSRLLNKSDTNTPKS